MKHIRNINTLENILFGTIIYIIEEPTIHSKERDYVFQKLIANFEDGIINEFMLGYELAVAMAAQALSHTPEDKEEVQAIINWFAACPEARKSVRDIRNIHMSGFTQEERDFLNKTWRTFGGTVDLTSLANL